MKKQTAITICALACALSLALFALPILLESMTGDALSAYGLIAAFAAVILLILHLLLRRKALSERELMKRLTILCWDVTGQGNGMLKKRIVLTVVALFAVAALAIGLLVASGSPINVAIPLAMAVFCALSGISTYNMNANYHDFGGENGFRLCHNALYLQGKRLKLDGVRTAISSVEADESTSTLKLQLFRSGAQFDLAIPIPQEKMQATLDFIADLNKHFEQQNSQL